MAVSSKQVRLSTLRYAIDTTLCASPENEMHNILERLQKTSSNFGLTINKSKTKIMTVDRFASLQQTTSIISNQFQRQPNICLQRILTYFGHILRRDSNNLEKLMVTGKKTRGRNPKRWSDQISQHLDILISTTIHQATNRVKWKDHTICYVLEQQRSHDPQH